MKEYEYVIVGAGIAGCSIAHFLHNKNILLIDKNEDVAIGASGAAGAFLSPLLGKPNKFKDLVTDALKFSVAFYKEQFPSDIDSCGVVRIPKNSDDTKKFLSYESSMDFEYSQKDGGYFFDIGARVNAYEICNNLSKNINKKFNYEIKHIDFIDGIWHLNGGEIQTKNLILTTGYNVDLIAEKYFNIRPVWGQKMDITTTTCIDVNYHKACSLARAKKTENSLLYKSSIGASHHRFGATMNFSKNYINEENSIHFSSFGYTQEVINNDINDLLEKANDIKPLKDVKITDIKIGARASSLDYFPMVGLLIDSQKTINMFPHLKNGTHVKDEKFTYYKNLFVLNGVGGRGFVLSTYLAKLLVDFIEKNQPLPEQIRVNRLFKRWIRKQS